VQQRAVDDLLALATMTLATTGATGEPHAAPVYFVADERMRLVDNRRGFGFKEEQTLS
jgi:hypothetical protein